MQAQPHKEHQWLAKLVGEWTYEHECPGEPGKPPHKLTGSESVRRLGELWTIGEGKGEMPGGAPALTVMTLGYDPQKKRFVGTWVGSMMSHLWVYEGELNESATTLTLSAEGPDCCNEGKMAKYRDVIEFKSDDHRTLTSYTPGPDGQWQQFMVANYRRKK